MGTTSSESENERQYKVTDLLLTAHNLLCERYSKRSCALSLTTLSLSIVLNALVFASDDILSILGQNADRARIGLGCVSVFLMILAIVELRVDWPARAERHRRAAEKLSELKHDFRSAYQIQEEPERTVTQQALAQEYARIMTDLPKVPERQFTRAKAQHVFKRAMSEEIATNPLVFHWILWLKLRAKGLKQLVAKSR